MDLGEDGDEFGIAVENDADDRPARGGSSGRGGAAGRGKPKVDLAWRRRETIR